MYIMSHIMSSTYTPMPTPTHTVVCTYVYMSSHSFNACHLGVCVPAVCDNGASVRRVELVHSANQLQDGNGLLGNTKVRPGDVVKLLNLSLFFAVLLKGAGWWWEW